MLHLALFNSGNATEVSCALNASSLIEMKKLDPAFCIGWIVGALGRWIARSNHPGSIRIETDSILMSIQSILPHFSDHDLADLIGLPCFTSRATYLLRKFIHSQREGEGGSFEVQLKRTDLGWACFRHFESMNVIPDAAMVSRHCMRNAARYDNNYETVRVEVTAQLAALGFPQLSSLS